MTARIPLPHPGVVLREEFLEPMGLSVYALAKAIGAPRSRINGICRGEQGITAAIALRLGKFFGVDPRWFMNMQTQYDLQIEAGRLADKIAAIAQEASGGAGGVAALQVCNAENCEAFYFIVRLFRDPQFPRQTYACAGVRRGAEGRGAGHCETSGHETVHARYRHAARRLAGSAG